MELSARSEQQKAKFASMGVLAILLTGCISETVNLSGVGSAVIRGIGYEEGANENEQFRRSAFNVLKGMTINEAVFSLRNSGFECSPTSCRYIYSNKLTTADMLFGVVNTEGSSLLGRRQTTRVIYLLDFVNATIKTDKDITATITTEVYYNDG